MLPNQATCLAPFDSLHAGFQPTFIPFRLRTDTNYSGAESLQLSIRPETSAARRVTCHLCQAAIERFGNFPDELNSESLHLPQPPALTSHAVGRHPIGRCAFGTELGRGLHVGLLREPESMI